MAKVILPSNTTFQSTSQIWRASLLQFMSGSGLILHQCYLLSFPSDFRVKL